MKIRRRVTGKSYLTPSIIKPNLSNHKLFQIKLVKLRLKFKNNLSLIKSMNKSNKGLKLFQQKKFRSIHKNRVKANLRTATANRLKNTCTSLNTILNKSQISVKKTNKYWIN